MKNLIYCFLLFSSVVFSQNYNYAIEEPQKITPPTLPVVNNQLEEIEYFKAYLLPLTKKATLQQALDKYGSIRLEKGDYSGVNIVMHSNQKLYGHPSLTEVSNITIAAGSSNVVLENLLPFDKKIILEAGGVISNCTIKSIKWATLEGINVMLENNTFINYGGAIKINCSASGYFRNNKIIRHQSGGLATVLTMKGNSTTPSYGNVNLWSNFLTPSGDTADIDNLQSVTFVDVNCEGWNLNNLGTTKPVLYMRNVGVVKVTDFSGADYAVGNWNTAPFDIDANELFFLNKNIQGQPTAPLSVVGAKTNILTYENTHDPYVRGAGTVTGFDLKAHYTSVFPPESTYGDVLFNNVVQTSLIANPAAITSSILGKQYTPWQRPVWEALPDPLGANWKTDRVNKTDSASYIQNLINTKGIAELPEGIFYIGSTLTVIKDGKHGVVGSGTGKTVICGLTDDFPLITLKERLTEGHDNFHLSYLTLQGGSVGVYSPDEILNPAFIWLNYVVFRNQNYGIHLYRNGGMDNNFFNNVSFIDCNIGFFQDINPDNSGGDYGYVDKVVFYKGQFLRNNIGCSMKANRANGINAWMDCKFDSNKVVIEAENNDFTILTNCDVTKNTGADYTISADLSYYNCKFENNTPTKATFMSRWTKIEGCDFLDNVKMFPEERHFEASYYILNSTITGDVVKTWGRNQAVYVNSNLLANPTLSKMLVNVKQGVPKVLINATPKPYPQLLVTQ